MATAMMDRYVYALVVRNKYQHFPSSLGQTPWLLDILWHMPFTKKMHLLDDLAALMMTNRVKSKDLPEYRDLSSYLVSIAMFITSCQQF